MKNILVVAKHNQAEALRVAAGLTLLSDPVRVAVLGRLEDTPAVNEHRELLEFAEVPCEELVDAPAWRGKLAAALVAADAVYVI
jgi:DNA-binding transcriptional ArsR family regulator